MHQALHGEKVVPVLYLTLIEMDQGSIQRATPEKDRVAFDRTSLRWSTYNAAICSQQAKPGVLLVISFRSFSVRTSSGSGRGSFPEQQHADCALLKKQQKVQGPT